jgi:TetR/AcrR family transcriptional regulator, cholesterol catabolism regulator
MAMAKRTHGGVVSPAAALPETGRRTLVLEAAASAFAELGYQGTSIIDICEGAGIAKPTVYHYFRSKAAILYQLLYDYIELLIAAAEAPDRGDLSPPKRLFAVMRDMVGMLDSHPGQVRLYHENAITFLAPAMQKRIRERRKHYTDLVEDILDEGRKTEFFRFADTQMTRRNIFALCGWPYTWYRPGDRLTTEEIATSAYELVISGIGAEPDGASTSRSTSRTRRTARNPSRR